MPQSHRLVRCGGHLEHPPSFLEIEDREHIRSVVFAVRNSWRGSINFDR
jgi:hypothetical protein